MSVSNRDDDHGSRGDLWASPREPPFLSSASAAIRRLDGFVRGFVPPVGSLIIKDLLLYQDAREHIVIEGPQIASHIYTEPYTAGALFVTYATK